MVSDQTICIVAPSKELASTRVLSLKRLERVHQGLDVLFERVGCVHFAAMALLPPHPGDSQKAPSALALELAVDDGLSPGDLVDLLIQHGFRQLWFVYGVFWDGARQASELTRRDWLRDFLLLNLHRADGGFVGARDRSVGQIQAETKLFQSAREFTFLRPLSPTDERASLARRIADWAADKHEFRWAAEPARRSFWRSKWMTPPVRTVLALAKLGWGLAFAGVLLNLLALLAFTGVIALALLLVAVDLSTLLDTPAVFGSYAEWSRCAVIGVTIVTALLLGLVTLSVSGVRSTSVAAFLLLASGVVLVVLMIGVLICSWIWNWPLTDWLGALAVLVKSGLLALLWVAAAWSVIVGSFLLGVLAVPPFLGLSGVLVTCLAISLAATAALHFLFGLFFASLVAASTVSPWLIAGVVFLLAVVVLSRFVRLPANIGLALALTLAIAWTTQFLTGLLTVVPGLGRPGVLSLSAVEGFAVLVFAIFSGLAYLISRWLRLPPFAERRFASKMDRLPPYDSDKLKAAHQVHASIEACEADLAARNRISHMFSLTEIREPTWLYSRMLRFYLWLVTYIGHTVFTEGKLANADGIRFGHWHVIDQGRRLLFCSNFDGAFGGYLDEFINGASEGVNLFWRWTELRKRSAAANGHPAVSIDRSYPPTRLGVFRGCKYEQWFKSFARDSMLPHIYRFEAYAYSARDVERASRLRDSLFGPRTDVNDDKIMRALES